MNIKGLDKRYTVALEGTGAPNNKVLRAGLSYVGRFCGDAIQGSYSESKEECIEYVKQWHIARMARL